MPLAERPGFGITNKYQLPRLFGDAEGPIMSDLGWLALYSVLIVIFSLAFGSLPLLGRVSHTRLQIYLSVSAGVMLGAAFFHVMPEAYELSGEYMGWWMALAVVGLFCIERFIAPHSHEVNGHGGHGHHHHHEHLPGEKRDLAEGHHHKHEHAAPPAGGKEPRAAAPALAGWMAVLGLTIHTFMNGFALAAQVNAEHQTVRLLLPGLAIFLAIFLHKPADALAISMVLSRKAVSNRTISLVQLGFVLMVPVGAAAYVLAKKFIGPALEHQLTGAALAFSAGTFLFIALSDLLPEVQFHQHDRLLLFALLALAVIGMGGIAILEDIGKGEEPAKEKKVENPVDHVRDSGTEPESHHERSH
jgi:zinc and cadmium transporter